MRAGAKLVWNVNLIRQVWLENVFGVGFDLVKKVVIGGTEQVLDGRKVVTAVPEPFGASQQQVETRVVGSRIAKNAHDDTLYFWRKSRNKIVSPSTRVSTIPDYSCLLHLHLASLPVICTFNCETEDR